jgi:hypothetical protein
MTIITKPATTQYRDGWERIFAAKQADEMTEAARKIERKNHEARQADADAATHEHADGSERRPSCPRCDWWDERTCRSEGGTAVNTEVQP